MYNIRSGGAVPGGELSRKLIEEVDARCDADILIVGVFRAALCTVALAANHLVITGFIYQWRWAFGVRIAATIVHCCRSRVFGLPVGARRRWCPLAEAAKD